MHTSLYTHPVLFMRTHREARCAGAMAETTTAVGGLREEAAKGGGITTGGSF